MIATIRDVARKAGVSVATVSRVISENGYPVASGTRARVLDAASALGYSPNLVARGLKKRTSRAIGLIVPDISNPFFPAVARGAEDVASRHDYTVVLCNTDEQLRKERQYLSLLRRHWIAGVLFATNKANTRHLRWLLEHNIPAVLVACDVEALPLDAVFVDSLHGAWLATRHLITLGHTRIAHVAGPSRIVVGRERLLGYRRAMAASGLQVRDDWVVAGDFHAEEGYRGTRSLLTRKDRPTAVFAANDLMALGVLRAAQEAGMHVPDDLAVVGFDDIPLAQMISPALTTVAQPTYRMGALAMERLLERIAGGSSGRRKIKLEPQLVIRQSCGAELGRKPPKGPPTTEGTRGETRRGIP